MQLICNTRWDEGDLSGRILNSEFGKRFTVLRLPARSHGPKGDANTPPDPLGRPEGEVLWVGGPEIPSVETGEISSREYAAVYDGDPIPGEGTIFKAPWFQHRYRAVPDDIEFKILAVDGAWKEGIGSSWSAIATWGMTPTRFVLLDMWRAHVEYPVLKANLISLSEQHEPDLVVVEDAASGIGLVQELRRNSRIPVIALPALGSKPARAEATTPVFEAGQVWIPDPSIAPWVEPWITEHLRAPNGGAWDQVDTTSIALNYLKKRFGHRRVWATLDNKAPADRKREWVEPVAVNAAEIMREGHTAG